MHPRSKWILTALFLAALPALAQSGSENCTNTRTVVADIVAFDQPFFWNRLGAVQPQGMMYALRRDVEPIDSSQGLVKGNVRLRADKRPRPIVLRMNVGDCLEIDFENLLAETPRDNQQPATREASVHVVGMQLVGNILWDGSHVGNNPNSLTLPGQSRSYLLYAEREGAYLMHSMGAVTGGEGDGGQINAGLFGAVTVQPRGAEWYRSQITEQEFRWATNGSSTTGHPIVNYNAVYPTGHRFAGQPILKMLHEGKIIHTDLTAMITGPNAGRFPPGTYPEVKVEPDREQPFREFVTIYHDEIGAVQAFPHFEDPVLKHTLHSARDAFAINYGTGGIGAEILANRFKIGPMKDCTECKYEEFFLSAWTVGDPAMVVDVPANAPCTKEQIQNGELGCFTQQIRKATKAFFPDDPSNVYHSYLRDHVKFRIVHAGSKEHHIHHQHTHQWLHTPDEDDSSYLDSQAIGPGSAFTLEMAYHGSGNRNLAVGDSIFHCHFYPHFAQGMWGMWRVHDVLETGTLLDPDGSGRPAITARALPDGEINRGTPIPGIVPLPTKAMAPIPGARVTIANGQVRIAGAGNPGYPFFIPGIAGHRPPHPPLDTIDDGGLPRHVIKGGTSSQTLTRLNFNKTLLTADALELPETGTAVEIAAMQFHEQRTHPTSKPDGTPGTFITNGLPRKPGAPYADPCVTDEGAATGNPRLYKAASFQLDVKFNKSGWHFPQQRITSLWNDVQPTKDGERAPEPLFFRANSRDCIEYHLVNLIPGHYEQDDFQVRTPTDIIGQHIHLVKFDVTASDGAANGFNYEDGSFAPEDVIERINAINANGGIVGLDGTTKRTLTARAHPFFNVVGAQTTVSRWYADDVLNNAGVDRTLRTVFTHDHFGPSTHQQAGLYAGLVIEPTGSTWRHPETGAMFGTRASDGGPTSWRADIITANTADSYREFLLEFADFQLAYEKNSNVFVDTAKAINPPGRVEDDIRNLLKPPPQCEGGVPPPCPEALSADDVGTMVVNYRNEPLALRVRDPQTNQQATGTAGDLAFAFSSDVTRADPDLNVQPTFYPRLTGGVQDKDPFTPLLRAYVNDKVQVRILVGAHEEGHNFAINGVKWLFEPSYADSGFRNSQMMGISEHYEFVLPPLTRHGQGNFTDYLYTTGRATDDLWNGLWGIMRAYAQNQQDLLKLPNNPHGMAPTIANLGDFTGSCPKLAPVRTFAVSAVRADRALPGNTLTYNRREMHKGTIHDPTAILYVRDSDLDANGRLKTDVPIEPLVLRAAAGDCINIQLTNRLPAGDQADLDGWNTLPMIVRQFNNNHIRPSSNVGLHPQLVFFDVTRSDGQNVGSNPVQTAAPGNRVDYQWYAGQIDVNATTQIATPVPIEFGAINLSPADPIKHAHKGAIGALIIEPQGSTWVEDASSRASATVTHGTNVFRDFVLQFQTDLNLRFGHPDSPIPNVAGIEDPEDSGHKAFNYRTEPMWKRLDYAPETPLEQTREFNFAHAFHNETIGNDPQTPIFTAQAGQAVRFRLLNPGGHARNNVFVLHGHIWRELPYVANSTRIGANPTSEWTGTFMGIGPSSHFDAVLENGAGGKFRVVGDFLFRTQASTQVDGGLWGLFRVTE